MVRIIDAQRALIDRALGVDQLELGFGAGEDDQRKQWEDDKKALEIRRVELLSEREEEPRAIEELYTVARRRLVPVGLVYLWPETRG